MKRYPNGTLRQVQSHWNLPNSQITRSGLQLRIADAENTSKRRYSPSQNEALLESIVRKWTPTSGQRNVSGAGSQARRGEEGGGWAPPRRSTYCLYCDSVLPTRRSKPIPEQPATECHKKGHGMLFTFYGITGIWSTGASGEATDSQIVGTSNKSASKLA